MIMTKTFEEAAEKLYQYKSENPPYTIITPKAKIEGFIAGAKWQQEQEKITTDDAYNEGFENGKHWQQERSYSEEDMLNASKYGYNFHKTTLFPNQKFEDSCINNTKQWLTLFKKK